MKQCCNARSDAKAGGLQLGGGSEWEPFFRRYVVGGGVGYVERVWGWIATFDVYKRLACLDLVAVLRRLFHNAHVVPQKAAMRWWHSMQNTRTAASG